MTGQHLVLHDYWRSGAAYRVRIALNLKGLPYAQIPVDLRTGAQSGTAYTALAPQGLVPALSIDGAAITQSLAVLEWLEETCPEPALLPADRQDRAIVRGMAALIACDIHPLNNLRVLNSLRRDLGADDSQVSAWIARWIHAGFAALETLIARHGDGFAFGASPTFVDCCLVPQVYAAERFAVDLTAFPTLVAAAATAARLDAFQAAHPANQPGAN